jgi:trehalose synthase
MVKLHEVEVDGLSPDHLDHLIGPTRAARFEITKRIHNHLYGTRGDGGPLAAGERQVYEETLRANADDLLALVRPGDVVVLHDPQTAGLAATVRRAGGVVV